MSDSDAAAAEPTEPAPVKKRKKKRKSAASQDGAAPHAREGWPAFAQSFPKHPDIEDLVAAFEQGNYARVRERAQKLMERTRKSAEGAEADEQAEQAEVRRAARELMRRIEPDPIATYLLIGASVLLAFLALWYWSHPHAAP